MEKVSKTINFISALLILLALVLKYLLNWIGGSYFFIILFAVLLLILSTLYEFSHSKASISERLRVIALPTLLAGTFLIIICLYIMETPGYSELLGFVWAGVVLDILGISMLVRANWLQGGGSKGAASMPMRTESSAKSAKASKARKKRPAKRSSRK